MGPGVMPYVRCKRSDIDEGRLARDLALLPEPSEKAIERQAIEAGDAWTEEDIADAVVVRPPPTADQVRAIRATTGLSQSQFASKFHFNIDTLQQYEQGRRVPSGPASTLLRVTEAEAVLRAVLRALNGRR